VGNANFAFSLQQLVNLPLLWSLEGHLSVTNATTPYPQAVPVRLLPTPVSWSCAKHHLDLFTVSGHLSLLRFRHQHMTDAMRNKLLYMPHSTAWTCRATQAWRP
jgi:ABC-type long-subunit fatty acid transport system fused permease/ATPase subunit